MADSVFEIYARLDRSNCRQCGEKSCLAFAGAVFTGNRPPSDCPRLPSEDVAALSGTSPGANPAWRQGVYYLEDLKKKIAALAEPEPWDASGRSRAPAGGGLAGRAAAIGAEYRQHPDGGRLVLRIFGKPFSVDDQGRIHTDIHVNPWIAVPALSLILMGEGRDPSGEWISFRELNGGPERYNLFHRRAELQLRRLADARRDLMEDLVRLFGGRTVVRPFEADLAVRLLPLPRLPLLLCYWRPEEGMESRLRLYFDGTADKNLDIESLFQLGVGFAAMLDKLFHRHGGTGSMNRLFFDP